MRRSAALALALAAILALAGCSHAPADPNRTATCQHVTEALTASAATPPDNGKLLEGMRGVLATGPKSTDPAVVAAVRRFKADAAAGNRVLLQDLQAVRAAAC